MKRKQIPKPLRSDDDNQKLSGVDAMTQALRVHAVEKYQEKQKAESEFARAARVLATLGLRVSFQTLEHIVLVYSSCALEGSSLTLEETARELGLEIIEKLRNQKEK